MANGLEATDPAAIFILTAADLDQHWALFQGLQVVSYQEYVNDSYTTIHTNIQALTQEEEKKEIDMGEGNFAFKKTRPFNMRASTFPGVKVTKRGKIIEADGTVWIVVSAVYRSFKTRWKCECYALNG